MEFWPRLRDLPLHVERVRVRALRREVSSGFTRVTTVVHLEGRGEGGAGEDVTYDAEDHEGAPAHLPALPLEFRGTLEGFSQRLDALALFPQPPERPSSLDYRRWALESAALDLALRQNGLGLAQALGLEARPVRFVVSLRLGSPPTAEPVRARLALYPWMRFKLDPATDWDESLVRELAELGVVEVLDFKAHYRHTPVDQPPDARLYRLVAEAFPDAWLEDPALDETTRPILAPHMHRVTWDAPIHRVADIEALELRPRMLNIKPSRFGTVRELLSAYAYCRRRGIGLYGGGQFELGPGRGQIQYLASLFHPDAPNDVAPRAYNEPVLGPGLPPSPLPPAPRPTGFAWREADSRGLGRS